MIRKDKNFWFRMTKEEKNLLRDAAKASGVSMARFLKDCILYFSKEENRESLFRDKEKVSLINKCNYELNRYGNNLNQIAFKLNRYKSNVDSIDFSEINHSLESIKQNIDAIKAKINSIN